MGKIRSFIFVILLNLMVLPVTVFAKESVEIKSLELDSKSNNTIIKSEPTFSGLEMNFDLSFKTIGDFAKYKVVIKNNTDVDYNISEDTSFNESEYMTYKYEVGDSLKANGETTVYITITYSKEVDSSKLTDNKYIESNKAIVQLLDSNGQTISVPDTLKNPNTGDNMVMLVIIILLCISITSLLLLNRKKRIKYMSLAIAIGLCAIPALVYAVETIKLTINVSVEIIESYPVNYIIYDTIKTSDKEIYKIFNFSEFGVDEKSCRSVEGKEGYEFCAIIYSTEMHAPGDIVTIPNEITYHAFNGNGELIENIVLMNNTKQSGVWDYSFYDLTVTTGQFNIWYWWEYNKDLNNFDDVDELIFTGSINNRWSNSAWPALDVYAPNSFTMPKHGVFFARIRSEWSS